MLVLPNVITKKLYPGGEIVQRRLVGCRGFSFPTCNHIEFGNLDLFTLRLNQNRSSIQLIYDLEYLLFELAGGRLGEEYPANSKVRRCALALGNERIGRLLDSVVGKSVSVLGTQNQPRVHRFPQRSMDGFRRLIFD